MDSRDMSRSTGQRRPPIQDRPKTSVAGREVLASRRANMKTAMKTNIRAGTNIRVGISTMAGINIRASIRSRIIIRPSTRPAIRTSGRNQYQKQSEEKNGMAITSLVMGILSLVTCCCGWIALVLGILGIIFAILSRGEDSMCSQAKAGLILSIIGVSIAILVIIAYIGLQMLSIIPDTF